MKKALVLMLLFAVGASAQIDREKKIREMKKFLAHERLQKCIDEEFAIVNEDEPDAIRDSERWTHFEFCKLAAVRLAQAFAIEHPDIAKDANEGKEPQ